MKTSILFFLFLLLSFTHTNNQAQTKWFKYAGNPVLERGATGEWDDKDVIDAYILWDSTTYHMWYGTDDGDGIGYATSLDGISWEKYPNNPVLEGDSGEWDTKIRPTTILFDGTHYKMYYHGWTNDLLISKTGLATSPDGINWTKDTLNNPILSSGGAGSWDTYAAWGGKVIYENSSYKMWYHGGADNRIWKIGYAESEDGIEWTKHLEPVIEQDVSETRPHAANPFVIFEDNQYSMWYWCTYTNYRDSQFNYATSTDGLEWNKSESNPILSCGIMGTWDDGNIWKPFVLKEGNLYKMWYSGARNNNYSIGYAEDFSNLVHADSVMVDGTYIIPNEEPTNILGGVKSPEGHALTAKAMILSDDGSNKDSVELFDDGLNGDGIAGDGIYGGYWQVTGENDYTVGIKTVDQVTGFTRNGLNWNITDRFSSKGPIVINSYSVVELSSNRIGLSDFKLKNDGTEKTIEGVSAKLITSDTCVTQITPDNAVFGDIISGESNNHTSAFAFYIDNSCSNKIAFKLKISSNGVVYWTDSLVVILTDVENELQNLPKEFSLEQNYPNPFNPSTVISYTLPSGVKGEMSNVKLVVYDVLGREVTTLVNEQQKAGYYEVQFTSNNVQLTSGVYFYQLRAGEFVETKKMVLLR